MLQISPEPSEDLNFLLYCDYLAWHIWKQGILMKTTKFIPKSCNEQTQHYWPADKTTFLNILSYLWSETWVFCSIFGKLHTKSTNRAPQKTQHRCSRLHLGASLKRGWCPRGPDNSVGPYTMRALQLPCRLWGLLHLQGQKMQLGLISKSQHKSLKGHHKQILRVSWCICLEARLIFYR